VLIIQPLHSVYELEHEHFYRFHFLTSNSKQHEANATETVQNMIVRNDLKTKLNVSNIIFSIFLLVSITMKNY